MHSCPYRVCYGDTDQMGFVYYGNYLRLFEMGLGDYMRAIGLPYSEIEREGILWPVAEAHVRYLAPAHYEDELLVDTALVKLGRVSAEFIYRIRRGDTIIARGRTRHASVDRQGRKVRISERARELLRIDAESIFA